MSAFFWWFDSVSFYGDDLHDKCVGVLQERFSFFHDNCSRFSYIHAFFEE